jgi:hypothetical protein
MHYASVAVQNQLAYAGMVVQNYHCMKAEFNQNNNCLGKATILGVGVLQTLIQSLVVIPVGTAVTTLAILKATMAAAVVHSLAALMCVVQQVRATDVYAHKAVGVV